jgi:hypothetical protein
MWGSTTRDVDSSGRVKVCERLVGKGCAQAWLNHGQQQSSRLQEVSSIVFLGAVGGATLVADQTPSAELGLRGWAVRPAAGRVLAFAGNRLHGVLPGGLCFPAL